MFNGRLVPFWASATEILRLIWQGRPKEGEGPWRGGGRGPTNLIKRGKEVTRMYTNVILDATF